MRGRIQLYLKTVLEKLATTLRELFTTPPPQKKFKKYALINKKKCYSYDDAE
jgi:hypothetical protein